MYAAESNDHGSTVNVNVLASNDSLAMTSSTLSESTLSGQSPDPSRRALRPRVTKSCFWRQPLPKSFEVQNGLFIKGGGVV